MEDYELRHYYKKIIRELLLLNHMIGSAHGRSIDWMWDFRRGVSDIESPKTETPTEAKPVEARG